jgi:cytidyltransferase-like protein
MGKKKVVVAVCGGFDPIHVGHIKHFKEAEALGDELVVLLNSDDWLRRKEIIESIRYVDRVVQHVEDQTGSVAKTLEKLKPDIFAKGGDRTISNIPKSEIETCRRLGIKIVEGVGGDKIESSSWLLEDAIKKVRKQKRN